MSCVRVRDAYVFVTEVLRRTRNHGRDDDIRDAEDAEDANDVDHPSSSPLRLVDLYAPTADEVAEARLAEAGAEETPAAAEEEEQEKKKKMMKKEDSRSGHDGGGGGGPTIPTKTMLRAGAVRLARHFATIYASSPAAPEILLPIVSHLDKSREKHTHDDLHGLIHQAERARIPLVQSFRLIREQKRALNPRFEDDFALGKSYDADRDRAQAKVLRRQIAKERRAVGRELKRDAAFMHGVREAQTERRDAERLAGQKRAFGFLQETEADFRSGGQGGQWKKGKKK